MGQALPSGPAGPGLMEGVVLILVTRFAGELPVRDNSWAGYVEMA
jgi:hypothetical protein